MNEAQPTTLSIFISSPGDVGQERLIADRVIKRLDAEFGDEVALMPYFWEYEPFLITADYQAQIPRPSQFDIFICILWSRLGSRLGSTYTLPPDHKRVANSGTEYEFVDAKLSHDVQQSPEILVWVNKTKVGAEDLDDPGLEDLRDQRRKLNSFLNEWVKDQEEGTFTGAVNRYATRDEFEEKLEMKLRKLIRKRLGDRADEIRSKPRWPGNPYRGLQAFEYRHSPIYFGRTAAGAEAIDHLAERLTAVWRDQEKADRVFEEFASRGVEPEDDDIPSPAARAFLLIWGASGSGKSSLAKAGVLPTLVKSGAVPGVGEWRCAIVKPSDGGKNPFLALAHALVRGEETPASIEKSDVPEGLEVEFCPAALPELVQDGRSIASIAQSLKEKPESAGELVRGAVATASAVLAEREKSHLRAAIGRDQKAGRTEDAKIIVQRLADYEPKRVCLALVLDQMEELFTGRYSENTLTTFFQVLDHLAASGRVAVIGTLRSEFFSRRLGKKEFQQILGATLAGGAEQKLPPPRPHELGQMIRKPAQAAGVRFEETVEHGKLDERIRDAAVREPDSLPLLEFCLWSLYEADIAPTEDKKSLESDKSSSLVLRRNTYEAFGELESAIANAADRAYRSIHHRDGALGLLTLFLQYDEESGKWIRRPAFVESIREKVSGVQFLEAFTKANLLAMGTSTRDVEQNATLVHDVLLTHWPMLARWMKDRENMSNFAANQTVERAFRPDKKSNSKAEVRSQSESDLDSMSDHQRANLDASALCPIYFQAGESEIVQIVVHLPEDRAVAIQQATVADSKARVAAPVESLGEVYLRDEIEVSLDVAGATVEGSPQRKTWMGRPLFFSFRVASDGQSKQIAARSIISVNGVPVGQIAFKRSVATKVSVSDFLYKWFRPRMSRFRRVFFSYSSEDRAEVKLRAEEYRKYGISFFMDALDLSPGERWKRRLWKEIDKCDLFVLFWTSDAKNSHYVILEAERAWRRQARNGGVRPVLRPEILENPPPLPDQDWLREFHFDAPYFHTHDGQ